MKTHRHAILILLAAAFAVTSSAQAQTTLLETDFQSHATGAATDASLNAVGVTTGGTWTLNTGRDATYTIEEDTAGSVGDKAVLMDDGTTSGTVAFATLELTSAADFGIDPATIHFTTVARRAGGGRDLLFEFLGRDSSHNEVVAANIRWNYTDPAMGEISFNGATALATNWNTFSEWNADAASTHLREVSAVFSASTVTLDFGGPVPLTSGPVAVLNGATVFTGLRVSSVGSAATVGLYLDDITVTGTAASPPPPMVTYSEFHYRGLADGDDTVPDLIRVYLPPSDMTGVETRPAILMIHGGNWTTGTLSQFYAFCNDLAEMGFVTATANYRLEGTNNKESGVADVRLATIWLESKAADFGFDDGRIILGGGSAGGHLATMVALHSRDPDQTSYNLSDVSVPALILFNPAYHVDETTSGSREIDPELQLARLLDNGRLPPPAIHFFGNYDPWRTPLVFLDASNADQQGKGRALPFIESCRQAGAESELWYAVGGTHGFFNATEWRERCIDATDDFLRGLAIIPAGEPPASYSHPELPFVLATAIHPWRLQWFKNEFAAGNADDSANPDGDMFDNFGEFALGRNPLVADWAAPLGFDPVSTSLTLNFSRRQHSYAFDDPAAVVELQTTITLATDLWEPVTLLPEYVVETTDGVETLAVPANTAEPARFYRLEIRSVP